MKKWPKNNKPGSFPFIADSIVHAIKAHYKLERKFPKKYKFKGYDLDKADLLSPDWVLKAKNLKETEEDQGRDALKEIISLAIQMGIQQGKRIETDRSSLSIGIQTIELGLGMIKKK